MTATHRRPLIAGNWKMNLTLRESVDLARRILDGLPGREAAPEVIVAPPYVALTVVSELLKDGRVRLAAQDMHWEASGAYTGEVSGPMLADAGCQAVILGHSERRRYFGDTDAIVQKKLKAALAHALVPIVCIGETLEEREAQKTFRVLETQVKGALAGFAPAELSSVVLAYEPVWAIGTGKTAAPEQAQEAHLFVRKQVAALYGDNLAQGMRLLYGGSVTPENVDTLMGQPDVDGALVGGASLKPVSFLRIVHFQPAASVRK
ncbi:MAG: triose-phosphate isomerase [Elusimicrobia bacterium]|nr:triose-phosphate isomerase [Elusimicrobiota bacterium]